LSQRVQVVGIPLHHLSALGQVGGVVVGGRDLVAFLVCELQLDVDIVEALLVQDGGGYAAARFIAIAALRSGGISAMTGPHPECPRACARRLQPPVPPDDAAREPGLDANRGELEHCIYMQYHRSRL
jgi:hypothetical protein